MNASRRKLFFAARKRTLDMAQATRLFHAKGAKGVRSVFSVHPDEWLFRNFHQELEYVRGLAGLKVRVNVGDVAAIRDLLPSLVVLADLLVFSPAPQWKCAYIPAQRHPWPGFVDGLFGTGDGQQTAWFPFDMLAFFAWAASARVFLEGGAVSFLPRWNSRWRHSPFQLPQLETSQVESEDQVLRTILEDLFIEHVVSDQLGCIHLDATAACSPLLVPKLPVRAAGRNAGKAYGLLKLRIPYVQNATYPEIWSILNDQSDSIRSFRRSIRKAVDELEKSDAIESRLRNLVASIQRDLIDEPLASLENKLRRIEHIRRAKYATYAIAGLAATLLSVTGQHELAAGALGSLSIVKLMETYLTDIERDVGLRSEALFWLTRFSR